LPSRYPSHFLILSIIPMTGLGIHNGLTLS